MTSRRLRRLRLSGILLAVSLAVRAEAAPESCALEAASSVRVGNDAAIDGSLLVGDPRGRAHLGRRVRVADSAVVTADLVVLGNDSSVFDVARGTLRRAVDAVVRGAETPATFPQARDCAIPAIACGGEDVVVGKLGARLLVPGTYGRLVAADGATVAVAPGAYTFCSIRTGRGVGLSISPGEPTSIAVAGDVVLGDGTLLQAPAGTAVPVLAVGGGRVKLPGETRVGAFIRSPLARLTVGRTTALTGGACAQSIELGRNVAFRCADAAPPPTTSTTTATVPATTSSTAAPTTSTSSTTPSTGPEPTSTSTTAGPATTSTSSTTSTSTTTTSTSTTTSPAGCGNGMTGTGETCDDGNNNDNDTCPADCRIDACTPLTTTQRYVQVHFQPPLGALVAGMTLLVDYPEGRVDLPGNALSFPSGTISGTPAGATIGANDLNFKGKGHAVRVNVAGQSGRALPPGQVIRFRFQDCSGTPAPTAESFLCTMLSASDPFLNPVSGVRCFVVVE